MLSKLCPPYQLSKEALFKAYSTSPYGLTEASAKERLSFYGPNELEQEPPISPFKIFLSQFTNFLIILLLIASGISLLLGEPLEALAIILIVFLAGFLGFLQEYQAEKSLQALKKLIKPTCLVLREGQIKEIPVKDLVPGDIILLQAGDRVPADGRLIEEEDFYVDEAILTGESFPVEKGIEPLLEKEVPPYDQRNMVFMGTIVVKGKGKIIVTATGKNTEFGKIGVLLQEAENKKTPLQERLDYASQKLGTFIVLLSVGIGILGVLKGYQIKEMFLWSIALAVAIIPEALPAVTTITLALGIKKMAKEKALVRKLPAVETLGSVNIICSDKTGTLTKNEMTAQRIFFKNQIIKITGVGYEPKGEFLLEDRTIEIDEDTKLFLIAGALCNNALLKFKEEEKRWEILGDPTEGALKVLAKKAGLNLDLLEKEFLKIAEIPFSSERMLMTTLHKREEEHFVFSKGALEKVLEISSFIIENSSIKKLDFQTKKALLKTAENFYQDGLRVLAIAYKKEKERPLYPEKDLIFLGIIGLIDPPREEVREAIETCLNSGIKVVMITGDHKITATAIGKEIGLYRGGLVLTGEDLKKLSLEDLEKEIEKVEIFARVLPEDKFRIVEAFKRKGYIVAMTGDGVNDAPALKEADIGIAMGKTGTEVAKSVSALILLEESFTTITKAIKEGRTIFENIRKFLLYLLIGNTATTLALVISLLIGLPLPLTALQILFINLLMDGAPALGLGLEPPEPDIMKIPPRSKKEPILNRESLNFLAFTSLWIVFLILSLYEYYLSMDPLKAGTVFFAGIITFRTINALNCKSLRLSILKTGLFNNFYLLLAILLSFTGLLIVLYTPLNKIFQVSPLALKDWLPIFLGASVIVGAEELRKKLKILT